MSAGLLSEREKTLLVNRVNETIRSALRDRYLSRGIRSDLDVTAERMIEGFDDFNLTVDKVFRTCEVHSHGHFTRFRKRFGITPRHFLEQARLLSALFLLRMEFSVHEASERSGFLLERKMHRVLESVLGLNGSAIRLGRNLAYLEKNQRLPKKSRTIIDLKNLIFEIGTLLE